ncbi:MAG TPA: UDP-N-acetylmuramate--L-alanine ligase [Microthrixaceae bacterium]|nr:UDP-N-acetylmuramate--L-alanine ligase [Microthrixaceae bacterium]
MTHNLSEKRRIHVVAAGGAGMSAIATLLTQQGHIVSGSDQTDSDSLRKLGEIGVSTHVGHSPYNVGDAELIVVSTAVSADNVEVLEAAHRGIPVLRLIDLLPELAAVQPFLSVSGTHGKTTTTSMLAVALESIGADPSFLIGASVPALGAAAGYRPGGYLVLEADESDGSFMAGPRAGAIVTNIEADHLEYWGSWEGLLEGFHEFLSQTDGPRVVCADDRVAMQVAEGLEIVSYGTSPGATYRMADIHTVGLSSSFTLTGQGVSHQVELAVPGLHNARNASAALAMVGALGMDISAAAAGLARYSGVSRRFEARGSLRGVQFVDDYAHLPTEVRAALAAAKGGGWGRVIATFQLHRYSRTEALWSEFADAFTDADVIVLTEIYSAGEAPRPGISGRLLFDAVLEAHPSAQVVWQPSLADAARYLAAELREGDMCMSIGAGDITTLSTLVMAQMDSDDV